MGFDTVNRGPSYADGRIFLHQADTTLVALDAKTGRAVWSVKNGDPAKGETGNALADCPGLASAVDAVEGILVALP